MNSNRDLFPYIVGLSLLSIVVIILLYLDKPVMALAAIGSYVLLTLGSRNA